jgi:hypothetical protein
MNLVSNSARLLPFSEDDFGDAEVDFNDRAPPGRSIPAISASTATQMDRPNSAADADQRNQILRPAPVFHLRISK